MTTEVRACAQVHIQKVMHISYLEVAGGQVYTFPRLTLPPNRSQCDSEACLNLESRRGIGPKAPHR